MVDDIIMLICYRIVGHCSQLDLSNYVSRDHAIGNIYTKMECNNYNDVTFGGLAQAYSKI